MKVLDKIMGKDKKEDTPEVKTKKDVKEVKKEDLFRLKLKKGMVDDIIKSLGKKMKKPSFTDIYGKPWVSYRDKLTKYKYEGKIFDSLVKHGIIRKGKFAGNRKDQDIYVTLISERLKYTLNDDLKSYKRI